MGIWIEDQQIQSQFHSQKAVRRWYASGIRPKKHLTKTYGIRDEAAAVEDVGLSDSD